MKIKTNQKGKSARTARQIQSALKRKRIFRRIGRKNRQIQKWISTSKVGRKIYLSDGHNGSRMKNILERTFIVLRKIKRIRLVVGVFLKLVSPPKISLANWNCYRYQILGLMDNLLPLLHHGHYGTQLHWGVQQNKHLKRFSRLASIFGIEKYDLWRMFTPFLRHGNNGFYWDFPMEWYLNSPKSAQITRAYDLYYRTELCIAGIQKRRIKFFKNKTNIRVCDHFEPYQGTIRGFQFKLDEIGIIAQTNQYWYDGFFGDHGNYGKLLTLDEIYILNKYRLDNAQYTHMFNSLPLPQDHLEIEHIQASSILEQARIQEERIDSLFDLIYNESEAYNEEMHRLINEFHDKNPTPSDQNDHFD